MNKIILAVDVSYGNTKLMWSVKSGVRREMVFTSQVLAVPKRVDAIDGLGGLDQVYFQIENQWYLVGPDVEGHGSNELTDDYSKSNAYKALVSGAIHYMIKKEGISIDTIDCLVLGLPVFNFYEKKEALRRQYSGIHYIPHPNGLKNVFGELARVNIKKTVVIPQPLGSLIDFISSGVTPGAKSELNLVLDPGYLTVDWLVGRGLKPIFHESGAFEGGVSAIIREVSEVFRRDSKVDVNASSIDLAMQSGSLKHYGREYDFTKYQNRAEEKARKIVSYLKAELNRTGNDKTAIKNRPLIT